jgi:hypothetical protein
MSLEGNGNQPESNMNIRGQITAHGRSVQEKSASTDMSEAGFGERLDKVELLIEELGQHTKYLDAFNDFVVEAKKDIWWLKVIRVGAVALSVAIILILIGAFICVVFYDTGWVWEAGDTVRASFLVSTVAGSIGILIVILKGAFRTLSERNKEDILPNHLKELKNIADEIVK